MSRISDYIEANPHNLSMVRQVIEMYEADVKEWKTTRCEVCHCKLSVEAASTISDSHFWKTCLQHRGYANSFQLPNEIIQGRPEMSVFVFGAP